MSNRLLPDLLLNGLLPLGARNTRCAAVGGIDRKECSALQAGILVLRPQTLTFLPTEAAKNVAMTLAGGIAATAAGVHQVRLSWLRDRDDPLEEIQQRWAEVPPDAFDRWLLEEARRQGGCELHAGDSHVVRNRAPRHSAMVFSKGPTQLTGSMPNAVLDELLRGWPEVTPPLAPMVLGGALLSLLPLAIAVVIFVLNWDNPAKWAGVFWLGVAAVMWVVLGIRIGTALRARKRIADGLEQTPP